MTKNHKRNEVFKMLNFLSVRKINSFRNKPALYIDKSNVGFIVDAKTIIKTIK